MRFVPNLVAATFAVDAERPIAEGIALAKFRVAPPMLSAGLGEEDIRHVLGRENEWQ